MTVVVLRGLQVYEVIGLHPRQCAQCVFVLKIFGIGCCDCLLCYSCLGMKSGLVDGHMTITHDIYRFFVLLNTWWNLHDWLSTVLYILIAPCSTTTPRKIYMIKGYGQQLSYVPSWKDYMYMEMIFKVFWPVYKLRMGLLS